MPLYVVPFKNLMTYLTAHRWPAERFDLWWLRREVIVARSRRMAPEIHRREHNNSCIIWDKWRLILGLTYVWHIVSTTWPEQNTADTVIWLKRSALSIRFYTNTSWYRHTSMWSLSRVCQIFLCQENAKLDPRNQYLLVTWVFFKYDLIITVGAEINNFNARYTSLM